MKRPEENPTRNHISYLNLLKKKIFNITNLKTHARKQCFSFLTASSMQPKCSHTKRKLLWKEKDSGRFQGLELNKSGFSSQVVRGMLLQYGTAV